MKILKWTDEHFEETVLIVLLILICCVELAQVVIRNIPWIPALSWAEEFCRFCWIWTVFLSLPYTIRKGGMLRVNALMDVLPEKIRWGFDFGVNIITAAAMAMLGVYSIGVVKNIYSSGETSPAMLWPMWAVYSVMLLGFFGAVARALQQLVILWNRKEDTLTNEQLVNLEAADIAEAETKDSLEGGLK